MPIRLNLLAEAQAAEEQRRRDPVKRALWIAALLTALMLVWASSLQLKAMIANQELQRVVGQMSAQTNDYKKVIESQKRINDFNHRLVSLHALSTNRFLAADLLDALQRAVLEEVRLSQLRVEQAYALVEGTKPKTNAAGVTPGRPPSATERITLTFEGSDSSPSPGDEVAKFKDLLSRQPYFEAHLGRTNGLNLKSLSAPQVSPESGRAIVLFTLEAKFPPKTR